MNYTRSPGGFSRLLAILTKEGVLTGAKPPASTILSQTEGQTAALNKAPYNPRAMESLLSKEGTVTSTTLPPKNMPNVKLAGNHKERTIVVNPETKETLTQRVVFDERGFPDFSPYMEYETRISGDLGKMSREAHQSAATRQLYADIQAGKVDKGLFSESQFSEIKGGAKKVPGYTWHHHQNPGRMQLINDDVHEWVGHTGGMKMWGGNK